MGVVVVYHPFTMGVGNKIFSQNDGLPGMLLVRFAEADRAFTVHQGVGHHGDVSSRFMAILAGVDQHAPVDTANEPVVT